MAEEEEISQMTVQEWMYIGYLKTISLLKVMEWLKPEDVIQLRASREKKMSSSPSTPSNAPLYTKMREECKRCGNVNFVKSTHGVIDVDAIESFVIDKLGGFMYIDELIYAIREPIGNLAEYQDERYGPILAIFEPQTHHITDSKTDKGFGEEMKRLNKEEMTKGGLSHVTTLDLKRLQLSSIKKKGLPYEIPSRENPAIFDSTLIRAAMDPIRVDRTWKSTRTYRLTKGTTWELNSY